MGSRRTSVDRNIGVLGLDFSNRWRNRANGVISHRGGQPGFIHVSGDTLWIPDFRGNRYMNTLGNLVTEPRAALLLIDFERGDILHLQGEVEIIWQPEQLQHRLEGAERYWCLTLHTIWRRREALPWRGRNVQYSPMTLRTGGWTVDDETRK